MSTAIIRLTKFNEKRLETMRMFKAALHQLEVAADAAIKQQVYSVKNPDLIIDEDFFNELLLGVAEVVPEYLRVSGKIESIIQTVNKQMSVEDLHINNDFSLTDYSAQLLR